MQARTLTERDMHSHNTSKTAMYVLCTSRLPLSLLGVVVFYDQKNRSEPIKLQQRELTCFSDMIERRDDDSENVID